MAPSGRTTTTTTSTRTTSKTNTTTRRRRTRQQRKTTTPPTNLKKKRQHNNTKSNKKQEIVPTILPSSCSSISSQDSSKEVDMHGSESSDVIDVSNNNNSVCSTPKGQKFRIPEISTCPPAPKKPRVLSNCSLRRSPLSFFSPPDLEHFFFVALRDVSV